MKPKTQKGITAIKEFDSIDSAVSASEGWCVGWVEQLHVDLFNDEWHVELNGPGLCCLLEMSFRVGHRLGVEIARERELVIEKHNQIFDDAMAVCKREFKTCHRGSA